MNLVRLAREWVVMGAQDDASRVSSYPGCGRYAADSWAIFMDGRDDVDPTDGPLAEWVRRIRLAKKRSKRRALGAYIFAGGFTVGVSKHFDVAAHLEETKYGVSTFTKNFPSTPVYYPPEAWPIEALADEPRFDFIYGNPPCAAWSQAGRSVVQGSDWRTDPRVDCTRRHFGLLERLRPRFWAWESVQPAFIKGREFVDELTSRANDTGYSVTYLLHNAMYLGVPQRRRRFFFVAHDVDFDIEALDWSWESSGDALRSMNYKGSPLDHNIGRHRALLSKVRQGEPLRDAWYREHPEPREKNERGQNKGCPPLSITRAHPDKPAGVVMHEMVHPTEDRALSIEELARLCGYPPDFEFVDARDAGQIGRGVCPPVGEWLARNVDRCLGLDRSIDKPYVQLIDMTEPPGRTVRPFSGAAGKEVTVATMKGKTMIATSNGGEAPFSPDNGEGSGAYMRRLMRAGYTDRDGILAAVRKRWPDSKAGPSDVAWNRAKLRSEGVDVQTKTSVSAPVVQTKTSVSAPVVQTAAAPVAMREKQPSRHRETVDPDREFDTTSLRANAHGQWVHRDYGAHFFRWGFAGRFVTNDTEVLDVGCGPDVQMINALTMPRNQVPKRYVGVDMNKEPRNHPTRQWATLMWETNFIKEHKKLGKFDLVTCFEAIEHMHADDGMKFLKGLAACLKPTGKLLLSTPVFNGKAAANHLHEWTIPELDDAIRRSGMRVDRRFGTFASQKDLKKAASAADLDVVRRLSDYYSGEVLSCFLAPLYPDASRNNVWMCSLK